MPDDRKIDKKAMIIACAHCGQNMDVSALKPYSNAICPSCHKEGRVMVEMGVYRIIEKIGIGGMSVVYKAVDTMLGRDVALKVLNARYGDDSERVYQFEEEAKVMAKVQHNNIVKVYAVGREWGCFYIAMEYVDGRDLETLVKEKGPLVEPRVLEVALQIVDGLDAAWQAGILHRDVKPANVLIDAANDAKIVDFGLALLGNNQSQENEVWATPHYASPEALKNENEDCRSDMYALGASLYQLLVGTPPFEKVPDSINKVLGLKKTQCKIQKIIPDISPSTCSIVNRLMEYNVSKRYVTYEELRRDIQKALSQLKQGNEDDWFENRRSLIRRAKRNNINRMIIYILTGVILLLCGCFFLFVEDKRQNDDLAYGDDHEPHEVSDKDQTLNIGDLYRTAESYLGENDLSNAKRMFALITGHSDCPLSTYVWSALQSSLCSWCLGDEHAAKIMLESIEEKINQEKNDANQQPIQGVLKVADYFLHQEKVGINEVFSSSDVEYPYFLVVKILKSWNSNKYKETLDLLNELKNDQSSAGVIWINILKPYAEDAKMLKGLEDMPHANMQDLELILGKIREYKSMQKTHGIAFRQSLMLLEKNLNKELEYLKQVKQGKTDFSGEQIAK